MRRGTEWAEEFEQIAYHKSLGPDSQDFLFISKQRVHKNHVNRLEDI